MVESNSLNRFDLRLPPRNCLRRNKRESLIHSNILLSRNHKVPSKPNLPRHLLPTLSGHLRVHQIALVPHKDHRQVQGRHIAQLLQPRRDGLKGMAVREVVDNHRSVGVAVVPGPECPEPFLPGGVPDDHSDEGVVGEGEVFAGVVEAHGGSRVF
uniref:Uncharacterized protein n=1 Tax=Arcella intermedia TaxID=1963864 RepID=A0A6B2LJ11_9EUKA